jgi:hypothetical protein
MTHTPFNRWSIAMKTTHLFRPALIAAALALALPAAQAAVPKDMLVIGKAADPLAVNPLYASDRTTRCLFSVR